MTEPRHDTDVYERVCQRLAEVTEYRPRGPENKRQARCPAHDDRSPSLSVGRGKDGQVLLHCHAGCDLGAVLTKLELTEADLFPPVDSTRLGSTTPRSQVVAQYRYTDEGGALLFIVERYEPGRNGARKSFAQVPATGRRGEGAMQGVRLVLYRLPELLAAVTAGRPVYVVEGEKDADRLVARGAVATTNPGGAGKFRAEYVDAFKGADVRVVADDDKTGLVHAAGVARLLDPVAERVEMLLPAHGCKDVADHLAAGHSLDELRRLELPAPEASPPAGDPPMWLDPYRGNDDGNANLLVSWYGDELR